MSYEYTNTVARNLENARLRELFDKGQKYGEPNRVNWKVTETMFF